MQSVKPVGVQAASRKYDLLSALAAHGLAGDRATQTRTLRLMALITTRYNWQRDELCVGQREIARLWSCDERTVKREMARLRAAGWLVQKTRGSRGRISTYRLDTLQIAEDTRPCWPLIGEDFVARLGARPPEPDPAGKVVPLRPAVSLTEEAEGVWGRARAILSEEQPAIFRAWLARLTEVERGQGTLVLSAPSAFCQSYIATHLIQALTAAVRRADPSIARVEVIH
ncbi:hypothetical protein [Rhodovulum kholense]|uniref:DnaA-like protein n=1 Tax=Rhodovulum kholense TaxID=453584 RepID=A0A8E2VHW6_9RHOB|nr:hypothetical protein [Rhodovulum kholense]PTW46596.1 hypothetical protein C8N38_11180 [Rhodovulum kholense]